MITKFTLFERKGDYQLYHKTMGMDTMYSIIMMGYIKAGSEFDCPLRKSVISDWDYGKYKAISATRSFTYMGLPALELDVEKISDNYRIIPFSENPDFHLSFIDLEGSGKGGGLSGGHEGGGYGKMKRGKNPNLTTHQNAIRSKSKGAGKLYWRVKTDKCASDFNISEELILADKLDVSKYVKTIYISKESKKFENLVKKKYPHIEVVVLTGYGEPYIKTKKVKNYQPQITKKKEIITNIETLEFTIRWEIGLTIKIKTKNGIGFIHNNTKFIILVDDENPNELSYYMITKDMLDNGDRSKDVKVINTPESIMNAIKKLSSVHVTT